MTPRDELHLAALVCLTRVNHVAGREVTGRAPHEAEAIREARELLPRLGQALRDAKSPPRPGDGQRPDPERVLEEAVFEARRLIATALPAKGARPRLLVAEPDEGVRRTILAVFEGYADVVAMADPAAAFSALAPGAFDVVIVDADPDSAGIALLEHLARTEREVGRVVLVRGRPSIADKGLMDEVAQLALAKPLPQEHLSTLLDLVPGAPPTSSLAWPALTLDDREWPLVRARLRRDPTELEWMEAEAALDAVLARGEPFGLLFATDPGARLTRPRRAALAKWMRARRDRLAELCVGFGFAFGSRAARLILAVFPTAEDAPFPHLAFMDEASAQRWLEKRLAERAQQGG